jgi:hypothetical protein
MELIRDVIEWFSSDTLSAFATVFPFLLLGLVGLYVLWLIVGYVRASQVGVHESHPPQPVIALPVPADGDAEVAHDRPGTYPRGVPYCAFDGLQYPNGARFCTRCERDLTLDCTNCGATLSASDASCYRCGTRTGVGAAALPG